MEQRKIHLYVWLGLAILLPISWLLAVLSIPDAVEQEPVRGDIAAALPIVVAKKESGEFLIRWLRDSAGQREQVEIFITKPLESPNTTVVLKKNAADTQLLGMLSTRGFYRFTLDSSQLQLPGFDLVFSDEIKLKVLRSVPLRRPVIQ